MEKTSLLTAALLSLGLSGAVNAKPPSAPLIAEPSSVISTEQQPQFPEILPIIEKYLEDCKATGKPMRIHLLDTNHNINEPSQVLADKSLYELTKKYGSPFYVIEAVTATDLTKTVQNYVAGDKTAQKTIDEFYQYKTPKEQNILKIIQYAKQNSQTHIIFPDQREAEGLAMIKTLPPNEQAVYQKFQDKLKTEGDKALKSGNSDNLQKTMMTEVIPKVMASFSYEEKLLLIKSAQKLKAITIGNDQFDTSIIDEKISNIVEQAFNKYTPSQHINDVQITFYGALHFTKDYDLDERMQGLSIAIADRSKLDQIRQSFLSEKTMDIHNDFPEYVYYPKEHRIIKLDNDVAKAEFLGIEVEQFKALELSKNLNGIIKLPNYEEQANLYFRQDNDKAPTNYKGRQH